MILSHSTAEGTLREGDYVKFRCDSQGRPLFKETYSNGWNDGTIVRIYGRKNQLYIMRVTLSNGDISSFALNSKNWPYDLTKISIHGAKI